MLEWAQASDVPATVLLTKADKLSRGAARSRHLKLSSELPEVVKALLFSAPQEAGCRRGKTARYRVVVERCG